MVELEQPPLGVSPIPAAVGTRLMVDSDQAAAYSCSRRSQDLVLRRTGPSFAPVEASAGPGWSRWCDGSDQRHLWFQKGDLDDPLAQQVATALCLLALWHD
jgi:hypothetical protein